MSGWLSVQVQEASKDLDLAMELVYREDELSEFDGALKNVLD